MPVIQLDDDKMLGKVLYQLMYKIGGTFHGREDRVLIVTDWQLKALQEAGLPVGNNQHKKANLQGAN